MFSNLTSNHVGTDISGPKQQQKHNPAMLNRFVGYALMAAI